MTTPTPLVSLSAFLLATLALHGCASRKYVRNEVSGLETKSETRIEEVEDQVEVNQSRLDEHD